MGAPSLIARGYPGEYPVSTADIADGAVNYLKVDEPLKKIVIRVVAGKFTNAGTTVTYDWALPTEWKGKLQVQEASVRATCAEPETMVWRVDGVDEPTLPVTANSSLGVKFTTIHTTDMYGYQVEATFVCEVVG